MSTQDKQSKPDKLTSQGVRDLDHKFPKKRPPVANAEGNVDASLPLPLVAAVPAAVVPPSNS